MRSYQDERIMKVQPSDEEKELSHLILMYAKEHGLTVTNILSSVVGHVIELMNDDAILTDDESGHTRKPVRTEPDIHEKGLKVADPEIRVQVNELPVKITLDISNGNTDDLIKEQYEELMKRKRLKRQRERLQGHNEMIAQFCKHWELFDKTRSIMATSLNAYSTAVKARRDMIHRGEGGCQETKEGDLYNEKR